MKVLKKILFGAIVLTCLLWFRGRILPLYITTNEYFGEADDEVLSKTYRRYPVPRELRWSGIFPIYGGWIDDPHMAKGSLVTSQIYYGEEETQSIKFQGIASNYFFDDESLQTNDLVVRTENETYSFAVPGFAFYNTAFGNDAIGDKFLILATSPDKIFFYYSSVYFPATGYEGGIVVVGLPFSDQNYEMIYNHDELRWKNVLRTIKNAAVRDEAIFALCSGVLYVLEIGKELSADSCD